MQTDGQTTRCRFCGGLYVFYMFYAGDQSACPSCVNKARNGQVTTTTGTGNAVKPCPTCHGSGTVAEGGAQ